MNAKKILPLAMLVLSSLLGACLPNISPVAQSHNVATAAAKTVQAQMTEALVGTLVSELTRVAEQNLATATPFPTLTEVPPTATQVPPTVTNTPIPPTATSVPPTRTATSIPCYWAQFVKDVTIPDDTVLNPGATFTKTWRLKNVGSCTWTNDFDLSFVSGKVMNAPAAVDLPTTVYPGDTIDLSVQMVAPTSSGTYTGYWDLRTGNGAHFGVGAGAATAFWVKIKVDDDYEPIDPDKPLNFVESYQSANWYTSNGSPSASDNYTNGSIYTTNTPHMEKTHTDDEPALIMIPSNGSGGQIYGEYPKVNIKNGDRLQGIIGCTSDSPDCNVMFQINYKIEGESTQNLGSWSEVYDGNWTFLDIDLSFLADKKVQFTLLVFNNGSSDDDRVFWLAPHIVR